jgi:hypothetical protein
VLYTQGDTVKYMSLIHDLICEYKTYQSHFVPRLLTLNVVMLNSGSVQFKHKFQEPIVIVMGNPGVPRENP